jgi:preprotein translocase SecE subunit
MGVVEYVKATQGEMRHVVWPNKRQVALYTATVVAISMFVAAILGMLDFAFLRGLRSAISNQNTDSGPIMENSAPSALMQGIQDSETTEVSEDIGLDIAPDNGASILDDRGIIESGVQN